jgi:hypothetical protein
MYKPDGSNDSQQKRSRSQPQPERQQPYANRSLDKYERFEAWLRENGGQFDLVSNYLFTQGTLRNICLPKAYLCV